jgi:mono/diheme cytochrome c family protein
MPVLAAGHGAAYAEIANRGMEPMRGWGAAAVAALVAIAAMGAARGETYQERGAYLVTTLGACGNCHTPRDAANQPLAGMALAGGRAFTAPELGRIVGPNITSDADTGIGGWSEDQIVFALRNGKRPDGTIIGPPMPVDMYRGLSDRDARAIAVYLKSLPPVPHRVARSQYEIPLPPSYGPPVEHVAETDHADKIAYGAYLAGPVAHCIECHTPRLGPQLDLSRTGVGGREFPDLAHPGWLTVSRNITPDPADGIGQWSDADVKRAILVGERPDGTKLALTMPFDAYYGMSSDDLNAIVDYLRSLKPLKTR